jgi:hypothetical protein
VVNGICNMESFKPIEKIKSKQPTATMLSHVRYVYPCRHACYRITLAAFIFPRTS